MKKQTRILYLGTPAISALVLKRLIDDGYNIVGVVAQGDKLQGRKQQIEVVPTKKVALEHNIPVFQPTKIRLDYEFVKDLNIDLIVCFAYGQIIPQGLLDIPPLGSINLHGSLLPALRGAAPIQYALIHGLKETGITLMQMIDKMDAGLMYAKKIVPITADDNYTRLADKMAVAAAELISEQLDNYIEGKLIGIEQNEAEVTFASMIKPEHEALKLTMKATEIVGWIKALSDQPGGYFIYKDQPLKVLDAYVVNSVVEAPIGTIVKADKSGLHLQVSDGQIALVSVQKPGKKVVFYKDFVNGEKMLLGTILQ